MFIVDGVSGLSLNGGNNNNDKGFDEHIFSCLCNEIASCLMADQVLRVSSDPKEIAFMSKILAEAEERAVVLAEQI